MRQDAATKGRRLLEEGRLVVTRVDPGSGLIVATCRGDSGEVYSLGYDPRGDGRWGCTCPAHGRCSHLHALMLVTERTRSPSG